MEKSRNNASLQSTITRKKESSFSKDRYSFSEIYSKKLEEKLTKKAMFEERSFYKGNQILAQEHMSRGKKRTSRLMSDTVKEVQQRMNFKYRELFFK